MERQQACHIDLDVEHRRHRCAQVSCARTRSQPRLVAGRFVAFLGSRDALSSGSADAGGGSGSGTSDAGAQIWIIASDGGEATKLTTHNGTIRALEWTKDSTSIVFTAEPGKTDAQKALEKAGDDAIFVDEGANGQERAEFTSLWRVSVASKTEQRVTHDDRLLIDDFQASPVDPYTNFTIQGRIVEGHGVRLDV